MKKYIKPVSDVIQTEVICSSFVQATIMNGNDKSTVVDNIHVYENQDPSGKTKDESGDWGTGAWGSDTWGGD